MLGHYSNKSSRLYSGTVILEHIPKKQKGKIEPKMLDFTDPEFWEIDKSIKSYFHDKDLNIHRIKTDIFSTTKLEEFINSYREKEGRKPRNLKLSPKFKVLIS